MQCAIGLTLAGLLAALGVAARAAAAQRRSSPRA